jgi:hypothetical protein
MSNPNPQSRRSKPTDSDDSGGLEKKLSDYGRKGGAQAGTDATKTLEGDIASAHAKHDQDLNKARPELSKTAKR